MDICAEVAAAGVTAAGAKRTSTMAAAAVAARSLVGAGPPYTQHRARPEVKCERRRISYVG